MQPELYLLVWSVISFWVLGQIWFVQIVVYPLFAKVGEAEYTRYHRFYTSCIPLPIILPGFASFLLPIALAFHGPAMPAWMTAANIAFGIVGLLVTVLLEIPCSKRPARTTGRSQSSSPTTGRARHLLRSRRP
ncbi:hypothetical protein [Mesorhizobium sp. AR10]|uniref:hypothetical protein n=1 Tax=Mesorhizobium sp. AR10 TaxID=2865839 RepID=UPI0021600EC7|nr:hypothetical protein [Mesorhizobium sp. AR10]